MKIILKQLTLTYFKGVRSLTVDFNDHTQNIHGANETGKSTIFNAFLWLLFGKDMEGRKDYEVKTTDDQGKEIPKIDHEVAGTFSIDGVTTVMKRTLKEKWVKPRGALQAEFTGNETVFEWNGVPMREKDYLEKINGIMKEDVFKLLTNPLYFNTGLTGYKITDWQARRNVLLSLAGDINDIDIAAGDTRFEALLKQLTGKSLDEYKKQIVAGKRKINERLEEIPARIDELSKSLPVPMDWDAVGLSILAKEKEIADVDQSLNDAAESQKEQNKKQLDKQNEIFTHRSRLQTIESEIRSQFVQDKNSREAQIKELRAYGRSKDTELNNLNIEHRRIDSQKAAIETRMTGLRADWAKVDATQPNAQSDELVCPSCHQALPTADIEKKIEAYNTYLTTFNANKVKRSNEIKTQGAELKNQVEGLNKSLEGYKLTIQTTEQEIVELRTRISGLEADSLKKNQEADQTITQQIADNQEGKGILLLIRAIEEEISAMQETGPDNSGLKTQRQALVTDLDILKKQLWVRDQIEQVAKRMEELNKEEKTLSQQLVEMEGIEFVIQEFNKAKIDALESRINHKFKFARFKLFDIQVNGQEVECCEAMYKGVVFGSLNTASRILVGIDIINVLSEHYGVSAPIFLDNRESVTSIPDTDAQIINLIVSPEDKQLRVA